MRMSVAVRLVVAWAAGATPSAAPAIVARTIAAARVVWAMVPLLGEVVACITDGMAVAFAPTRHPRVNDPSPGGLPASARPPCPVLGGATARMYARDDRTCPRRACVPPHRPSS